MRIRDIYYNVPLSLVILTVLVAIVLALLFGLAIAQSPPAHVELQAKPCSTFVPIEPLEFEAQRLVCPVCGRCCPTLYKSDDPIFPGELCGLPYVDLEYRCSTTGQKFTQITVYGETIVWGRWQVDEPKGEPVVDSTSLTWDRDSVLIKKMIDDFFTTAADSVWFNDEPEPHFTEGERQKLRQMLQWWMEGRE